MLSPDEISYSHETAERILRGIQGDASFLSTPSSKELKRKHEVLSKRSIALKLHMMTLGEYYRNHRIPRGMRSHLQPNLFMDNDEFCKMFELLSNKYSLLFY